MRTLVRDIVAIDGKTLRRSFDHAASQGAIHMVSAWANANRLVLGQLKVDDKSNESTAIPKLLKMLALEGAIVTIDAMGCQHEIAKTITAQGAEYVLALKDNHPTLHGEGACSHFSGQASSSARCEVAICFNRFHRPAL